MLLKYGSRTISFQPDPSVAWQLLPEVEPGGAEAGNTASIRLAIHELLRQMAEQGAGAGENLLVVVPDHTRRCRLEQILPLLLPALEERFSPQIRLLVANGSHVLQPDELVCEVVGADVFARYPVVQHDAHYEAGLVSLGTTSTGTPVAINQMALEADRIITIGGILYHYFAGFGGGPKMLLPGIAGLETIRINHRRTLDPATGQFHAECREGNIETNPVFLDLAEIVRFLPQALSLQLVLSPRGEIVEAAAGPILPIQKRLIPAVRLHYGLPIVGRADVVIASAGGHPADVNLIQAHKSIHHAFQALKPGGALILLAECREGIGSSSFMGYFTGRSAGEMGAELLRNYLINGHTALALRSKTEQARIILVSELDAGLVCSTGMSPAGSIAEAWDLARPHLPDRAKGYIMPAAAKYLPLP